MRLLATGLLGVVAGLAPGGGPDPQLRILLPAAEVAPGELTVGVTLVDSSGNARLPAQELQVIAGGRSVAPLQAQGPVRLFRVRAEGGGLVLTARQAGAQEARVQLEVGPPAEKVEVSVDPPRPIKGKDTEAVLSISVLKPNGSPDPESPPPVVRANVGEIVDLRSAGAGRFSARYLLPKERYPEVAIVVAFAAWPHPASALGAFGRAVIPLASAVTLPGRTEPNASYSVEIAGQPFGPVRSDAQGRFEIPVVVPPGHRFGGGTAVDRVGNRRLKKVDLRLPPTDQIGCIASPTTLPADGRARARILCVATDPFGAPVAGARVEGAASAGTLGRPRELPAGTYEWSYTAPAKLGSGAATLSFTYAAGGADSREAVNFSLTPPAPASVEVAVSADPVHQGAKAAQIALKVLSAAGELSPHATVVLEAARGAVSVLKEGPGGLYSADYTPPAVLGEWTDELSYSVWPSPGGPAAELLLGMEEGAIWVQTRDPAGRPVPKAQVALEPGGERVETDGRGLAKVPAPKSQGSVTHLGAHLVDSQAVRADAWLLATPKGSVFFPAAAAPAALAGHMTVRLAPETPVDVRISVSGRKVSYRVVDAAGKTLEGRRVAVEVLGGKAARARPEGGQMAFEVDRGGAGPAQVTVTDVETGVSAFAEVLP